MDKLPDALVLEILSRLDDSSDVARCRVAWKTFDTVSPYLRSINLQWPLRRYIESRFRVPNSSSSSQRTSPLKTIFLNLISNLRVIESVHIVAENLTGTDVMIKFLPDNGDDLYLTDGGFFKEWLPRVSDALKSLSISDFWLQSSWRRSKVLSLVSVYCHNLLDLELKHAWLSVDNLHPMPMLTSLTLESILLYNEDLSQMNKCFPNLQVFNLIHVRGVKLLKIHLLNLKTCHCTGLNSPSYVTLIAPNLIKLKLGCIWSTALYVEAPMLSNFKLSIDRIVGEFTIKNFENLKTLFLNSTNIRSVLIKFPLTETVENLTLDTQVGNIREVEDFKFTLEELFCVFPSVTSLCFASRVWKQFEVWYGSQDGLEGLKTFRGYLFMVDPPLTFSLVACVLDQCFNLVDVSLLIHRHVDHYVSRYFIGRCMAQWPKVKWKWGMWEEGKEDYWITDDISNSKTSKKFSRKARIPFVKKLRN